MLEAGLILSRFIHYTATLTLFGISLFPFYTYPGFPGATRAQRRRWMRASWWTALVALLTAVVWFASVLASMTGTLDGFLDRDAVLSVVSETSFGKVWIVRFVLGAIILVVTAPRTQVLRAPLSWLAPTLCAGLLVSLASVGHTQIEGGIARFVHTGADGLHLLAAGAWLGGLIALFYVVAQAVGTMSPECNIEARSAAIRFSGMGYIAAATLVGSGLINSWFLVGAFGNLGTPYGQILIVKLVLFAGMLGLAALNRFFLVPILLKACDSGQPAGLRNLKRHIFGELALGVLVMLIVSLLGTMQPAINLS